MAGSTIQDITSQGLVQVATGSTGTFGWIRAGGATTLDGPGNHRLWYKFPHDQFDANGVDTIDGLAAGTPISIVWHDSAGEELGREDGTITRTIPGSGYFVAELPNVTQPFNHFRGNNQNRFALVVRQLTNFELNDDLTVNTGADLTLADRVAFPANHLLTVDGLGQVTSIDPQNLDLGGSADGIAIEAGLDSTTVFTGGNNSRRVVGETATWGGVSQSLLRPADANGRVQTSQLSTAAVIPNTQWFGTAGNEVFQGGAYGVKVSNVNSFRVGEWIAIQSASCTIIAQISAIVASDRWIFFNAFRNTNAAFSSTVNDYGVGNYIVNLDLEGDAITSQTFNVNGAYNTLAANGGFTNQPVANWKIFRASSQGKPSRTSITLNQINLEGVEDTSDGVDVNPSSINLSSNAIFNWRKIGGSYQASVDPLFINRYINILQRGHAEITGVHPVCTASPRFYTTETLDDIVNVSSNFAANQALNHASFPIVVVDGVTGRGAQGERAITGRGNPPYQPGDRVQIFNADRSILIYAVVARYGEFGRNADDIAQEQINGVCNPYTVYRGSLMRFENFNVVRGSSSVRIADLMIDIRPPSSEAASTTVWDEQGSAGEGRFPFTTNINFTGAGVTATQETREINGVNTTVVDVDIPGGSGGNSNGLRIATQTFTDMTTWSFSHGLGVAYPQVTVWEDDGGVRQIVLPESVVHNDNDTITVSFPDQRSGAIVVVAQ